MKIIFLFTLLLFSLPLTGQYFEQYLKKNEPVSIDTLIWIYQSQIETLDSIRAFKNINEIKQPNFKLPHYSKNILFNYFMGNYYSTGEQESPRAALPFFQKNITYYKQNPAQKSFDKILYALNLHFMARHLYINQLERVDLLLNYFLEADQIFRELSYNRSPIPLQLLSNLGEFFYRNKEYKTALVYLKEATPHFEQEHGSRIKINHLNTLALCYIHLKMYDPALTELSRLIKTVEQPSDSIWVGIASGNMAEIFYRQGNIEKAIKCLEIDFNYSVKYDDACSACEALLLTIKCYLKLKNLPQTYHYLQKSLTWADKCNSRHTYKNYLNASANYHAAIDDFKTAYTDSKLATYIKDSLRVARMEQQIQANVAIFKSEQYKTNLALVKKQEALVSLQRNFVFFVAVIVILLLLAVFKVRQINLERKKHKTDLENHKLSQKLAEAAKKLHDFSDSTRQKNDLIESIQKELTLIQKDVTQEEIIKRLSKATILTQKDWLQFTHLFEQVHPNFFNTLNKTYPQLSKAEIRLLALSKLEFSTKEMAGMLGISTDAIHKGRYRLRKKLQLPREDDFKNLIREVSE